MEEEDEECKYVEALIWENPSYTTLPNIQRAMGRLAARIPYSDAKHVTSTFPSFLQWNFGNYMADLFILCSQSLLVDQSSKSTKFPYLEFPCAP